MSDDATADEGSAPMRLAFRLGVGLVQGFALAFLYEAADAKHWPAHNASIFVPALILAALWPAVLELSANMRRASRLLWALVAAAALIALGYYDVWRSAPETQAWPTGPLLAALLPLCFVAECLAVAADSDRRPIAAYTTYFDTAWKLGLQGALGIAFVGLLWIVLQIGAELFHLIGINALRRVIENRWFAIPVSTVAFAYSIELTDMRVGLVRGLRTLALTLQAWILPVMVGLALAFLLALLFTGLTPLWATRSATALLLTAAAAIVFLINAAYRDGTREGGGRPAAIRIAARAGALALVPIVAIAGYALMLRIGEHGLTPQRITAFACCVMAACLAIGYALSATNLGGWLKGVEATNIFAAFLGIVLIAALHSPLADPARLSVKDQVSRLAAGKITAADFDYDFLRFKAGRFGRAALDALAKQGVGKEPDRVAVLAGLAAKRERPSLETPNEARKLTPAELAASITVYPHGAKLPDAFLAHDWANDKTTYAGTPACLRGDGPCDALVIDLNGDGEDDVVTIAGDYDLRAFIATPGGFQEAGVFWPICSGSAQALKSGTFSLSPHPYEDIVIGSERLSVHGECSPRN